MISTGYCLLGQSQPVDIIDYYESTIKNINDINALLAPGASV